MEKYQEIERSIIKKFRKPIWRNFVKACQDYNLIEENDKIAVCISGGKDSMLLAKCMQEIQRHGNKKFDMEFIVMDPGYSSINRELIIENAKTMGIDIKIFDSDIFEVSTTLTESPCYLCARMRRGFLYARAEELGCNKIALGHHFDDMIETVLLSMFYGSEFKTMLPKLRSDNFKGMELIRPLYLVKEKDIKAWRDYNGLKFLACACKVTEAITNKTYNIASKRQEVKELIENLRKVNPNVDLNIFLSAHNVNLDAVCGYRKNKNYYDFNKIYEGDKNEEFSKEE